ncbi:hypothetical protein [Prescottella agglutinans]|uniref:Uncharacterized protein n=1 Tax=Prescottella agglutinans TaxID=1644129 RepID=A0ABT6MJL9_9NOCA|nr:hypothetical protein [Prescottella agglutinans]MDH6284509.1 hypothetical protein [Prescottella agglutinans]
MSTLHSFALFAVIVLALLAASDGARRIAQARDSVWGTWIAVALFAVIGAGTVAGLMWLPAGAFLVPEGD